MSTKFFTNKNDNTLLKKFEGVFGANHVKEFDALVGYFRATGYSKLRPHLQRVSQVRILVGIDVDALTQQAQQKGLAFSFGASDTQVTEDYCTKFKKEINAANYRQDLEQSVEYFIDDIKQKKIIIKAHPSKKIHAKLYIMRPQNFNQHSSGEVITGSSNLTQAGIGSDANNSNYEFNVLLRDYDDVKFASDEFEQLWGEAIDILPVSIEEAKKNTHLRDDITSFQLYIKLLIGYYGSEVNFNPNSLGDLPEGFKRLEYQIDAVEQGYQLLKKHNGFFLSDVVGLGKTVIAVMIARKYFHHNDFPSYQSRTLIICPPAVKENWSDTVDKFKLGHVTIETNGSLHKITEPDFDKKRKSFDLVIVDESHNFRNSDPERYKNLEIICKSETSKNAVNQDYVPTKMKVILVSATPMNNGPADIKNQLLLFQDGNDSTLDIALESYFREAIKKYKELLKRKPVSQQSEPSENNIKLDQLIEDIRIKVIEPVTVRRTRTDLMASEDYKKDLQQQGITFPQVHPPKKMLYVLEPQLNELYDKTVQIIGSEDSEFNYAVYRLIEFLKPDHKKDYFRANFIAARLQKLMKVLLLKRIDSSFQAFNSSLQRFVKTAEKLIAMFEKNKVYLAPNIDIDKYLEADDEEGLIDKLIEKQSTDPTIKILTADDFEVNYLPLLKSDLEVLKTLQQQWQNVIDKHPDPKLDELKKQLKSGILNEQYNKTGQCVIFSESAVTTEYLSNELTRAGYRVLAVTAKNRERLKDIIKQNFDANCDLKYKKSDHDLIIATETLAEGINLHRANSVVNYDTPWNSTRLMQRIGRVNRIGSSASDIYVYNFFPTQKVEDEIGLKQRAQKKLQAFHIALGEDSQIYSTEERVATFGMYDKTIKENEQITERFKYLLELRKFKQEHPDQFKIIKNLPLKIRNAVTDLTQPTVDQQSGVSTLCFLRNQRRNVFYLFRQDGEIEDLGFLKAVQYFERHSKQVSKALPEYHYQSVTKCVQQFIKQGQQKTISEENAKPSQKQQQAVEYLKSFLNESISSAQDKSQLQQGIEWIRIGRFRNFHKDINEIAKKSNQKVLASRAKQLEVIIDKIEYYGSRAESSEQAQNPQTTVDSKDIKPQIVISQTYCLKTQ